ncbi:PREDICTED: stathmin domain-containing protein 1, partial [Buceros rhinoceros silvestris]|uniref:stathmin domain-containing protein 1 n=1 Tax=Buceros rhinoceros silvestris TaxID=175836 RepID=UPI000528C4C1
MGCTISHRVAVAPLSSEELQNNQEAKRQDEAARPTDISKDGAKCEDETSEEDSPEELPERFTSSQKSRSAQSTDTWLTSKFISKSQCLQEGEGQKSSDILEELRVQGIIKSQSTTARSGEVYENK